MTPTLAQILATHRAVVCVGTGGVGKTTTAAALGVAAAMAGRRTMVITIDPARQLARALGLASLSRGGERVPQAAIDAAGLSLPGELHAAMLDQKAAWDAFITRHAGSDETRKTLLDNRFYQQLSTSFAGSTEFMAVEELCHLDEQGQYDLIIIDTPPAGHAVDFLRAPERIEKLLDPEVAKWLSVPYRALSSNPFSVGAVTMRFVMRQLERAFGGATVREVSAFFIALNAIFGNLAERASRARALLLGPKTAFVLVSSPRAQSLADGGELAATMRGLHVPLKAAVINRVHPLPSPCASGERGRGEGPNGAPSPELSPPLQHWLTETLEAARHLSSEESSRLAQFSASLPPGTTWAEVPELDHDAHSLTDLAELARLMGALPSP